MSRWQQALVGGEISIREAVQVLDASELQIVLVVDAEQHLAGTVTDGDVRRGILKGVSLDETVQRIMNPAPTTVSTNDSRESVLALMQRKQLRHIPVIDQSGRVVGLETLDGLVQSRTKPNRVVLMAGGLGSRLQPLTDDCPKPMLRVGTKPLLETILENFIDFGFRRFSIAVNYLADVVQSHFGDGARWGVEIDYLRETRQLGTAGALSLLPEIPMEPLLVMNGDVLTKVNFGQLLDFHNGHRASATMCVREYDFQIPYGVVRIDRHRLASIEEKPVQRFFVNAGIYVLEPNVLRLLPTNERFDMPALFGKLVEHGHDTSVFPIREYWLDIGQLADYDRANGEFTQMFS
jgi:dTDP-glucose pyrophosphorylase/predicted transcriptional regulator